MRLQQFSYAERMNTISELVRTEIDQHINEGGTYFDEKAKRIAHQAVMTCMPELPKFLQEQVVVDTDDSILLEDLGGKPLEGTVTKRLDGAHVMARLAKVELQAFRVTNPELQVDMDFYDYGMFAVMEPTFVDADPGEIVMGNELYVSFSGVTLFEPSEQRAA